MHALRVKARIIAIHLSEKICRQPAYAEHIGVSIEYGEKGSLIDNTIHENHAKVDSSQSHSARIGKKFISKKVLTKTFY